jgi:Domain of unknown function (DUF4180)
MHGFTTSTDGGFIEAPPDAPLILRIDDVTVLLESAVAAHVRSILLYPKNLTANFFDLSSGEAGAILQKMQTYRLRVAVVLAPGSVPISSRFGEITGEVSGFFRIFETANKAREWLRDG